MAFSLLAHISPQYKILHVRFVCTHRHGCVPGTRQLVQPYEFGRKNKLRKRRKRGAGQAH